MASKTFDSLLTDAGFETYEAVAKAAGVSRHTLWRWRDGFPPRRSSATVNIVAHTLKTTPDILLKSFPRKRALSRT